ncbi:MAG: FkbM family methyltransferase [Nitrospiraceae bacterium]
MSDLETKVVAHHVGGRGFGVAFNVPQKFRSDISHVLYEADPESIEDMNRNSDGAQASLLDEPQILPYCLGRTNGSGKLNITANAYASSMLVPDPSFFRYYCQIQIPPAFYDVTYDDMLQVVKRVEVNIHSLDGLFAEGALPPKMQPDFLSLDTQGLEKDIMEGAKGVIHQGVLGIITEFEVEPMYKGQPLLGDILQIMNQYGFQFAGFTSLYEISSCRGPIGLRGKAFPGFGDALFLRKLETLKDLGMTQSALFLKTTKLAFIALVFGYVECALEALEATRRLRYDVDESLLARLDGRSYWKFLQEVESVVAEMDPVYPPIFGVPQWARPGDCNGAAPTWSDVHHDEAVRQFHRTTKQPATSLGPSSESPRGFFRSFAKYLRWVFLLEPAVSSPRLRTLAVTKPHKAAIKAAYYLIRWLGLISQGKDARLRDEAVGLLAPGLEQLGIKDGYSAFESVLAKYGLVAIADTVRRKRIDMERFVLSLDTELRTAVGWGRPGAMMPK